MNEQSIKIHWDFPHTRVLVGGPDPTLQLSFLLMLLLAHEVWWDGALLCYCSQDWFNAFIRSISTTHCITIIAMITSVSPK